MIEAASDATSDASSRGRFAYLHGFGSGPESTKGRALATAFLAAGVQLDKLDLNRPSFSETTFTASLAAIDDWYSKDPTAQLRRAGEGEARRAQQEISLVGSSLGGYFAARWAELNPTAMRALVLLCPGLDMAQRWPTLIGDAGMARWRQDGVLNLPNARGVPTPVHWGFIEDAQTHPPVPRPSCATLVIHGTRDAMVPIEGSRAWVASLPNARLIEVDDVHELYASMPLILSESLAFLASPRAPG